MYGVATVRFRAGCAAEAAVYWRAGRLCRFLKSCRNRLSTIYGYSCKNLHNLALILLDFFADTASWKICSLILLRLASPEIMHTRASGKFYFVYRELILFSVLHFILNIHHTYIKHFFSLENKNRNNDIR